MAFLLYYYSYMDKEEKAKDCITLIESNPLEEFDERNGTGSHQAAAGAGYLHGAADAGLLPDADRPVEDADSEHDQPLPLHRLALGEEIQLGPRRGKRMSG